MKVTILRRQLFSPVIICAAVVSAALGAALAYGPLLSYKSRAVVSFERSLSEFKTLQEQLNSSRVFDRYLLAEPDDTKRTAARQQLLRSDTWITPVLRVSKKDAKELSSLKESGGLSDVLGYEVSTSLADPEIAQAMVELLADYAADASLKIQIDNFIADSLAAKRLLLTSSSLEKDTETYNLTLLEERLADLKRLSKTYPAEMTSSDRQILSIEKNGERYMPLPMQMIAVERERFDINERLAKTQRRVAGLPDEETLLIAHENIARKTSSGRALAAALVKDIQGRLPDAKKGYEVIALLEYKDKYSRMLSGVFAPSRFMVSPTLPEIPLRSPLKTTVLLGLLGAVLAFLWQFRRDIQAMVKKYVGSDEAISYNDAPADIKKLHRA